MKSVKFSFAIGMVLFFSFTLLVSPVAHLFQNRAFEFVRQVSIDSICTIVGLLGLFTVSALLRINRKLSDLEKTASSQRKGD